MALLKHSNRALEALSTRCSLVKYVLHAYEVKYIQPNRRSSVYSRGVRIGQVGPAERERLVGVGDEAEIAVAYGKVLLLHLTTL